MLEKFCKTNVKPKKLKRSKSWRNKQWSGTRRKSKKITKTSWKQSMTMKILYSSKDCKLTKDSRISTLKALKTTLFLQIWRERSKNLILWIKLRKCRNITKRNLMRRNLNIRWRWIRTRKQECGTKWRIKKEFWIKTHFMLMNLWKNPSDTPIYQDISGITRKISRISIDLTEKLLFSKTKRCILQWMLMHNQLSTVET